MQIPDIPEVFFGRRKPEAYAIQAHLTYLGFSPGPIDGFWGPRSQGAYGEWQKSLTPNPVPVGRQTLTQQDAIRIFGHPGADLESRLVHINPPYEMFIEWDPASVVRSIRVHPLIARQLLGVLERIDRELTKQQITHYGLRAFSGVYAHRFQTEGKSWSKHAFGIAIDLNAAENAYHTPWAQSRFASPELRPVVQMFEQAGFVNLGKVIGRDSMHFEYSREAAFRLLKQ